MTNKESLEAYNSSKLLVNYSARENLNCFKDSLNSGRQNFFRHQAILFCIKSL